MSTEYKCIPFELDYYESAPQRFVYERTIECSPDELFDIFEDEHSWPVWGTGIAKVDWTSPKPYKVGTTRTVTFQGDARPIADLQCLIEAGAGEQGLDELPASLAYLRG